MFSLTQYCQQQDRIYLGSCYPQLDVDICTQTCILEGMLNCVLACHLLEISLIVFQTNVDTLNEVVRVSDSSEEVILDQCNII